MLFLARFAGDLLPVLVGGDTAEEVAAAVEKETGERATALFQVKLGGGVVLGEVKFSTLEEGIPFPRSLDDCDGNPANLSEMGVVLEPFEDFAEWLETADELALPSAAELAPTEPAAAAAEEVPGG